MELRNRRVRLFLKKGFRYEGRILSADDNYIVLHDERTDIQTMFSRDAIAQIDLLSGEKT